ncbi:hypothetical protein [Hoeflea marina]|uniref:hypothetical protein n=1 Tax=Hoeflea marina TaxID=274592 RepID=UPI001304CC36|nr:hypothetical protein [Hoeflea marina]
MTVEDKTNPAEAFVESGSIFRQRTKLFGAAAGSLFFSYAAPLRMMRRTGRRGPDDV